MPIGKDALAAALCLIAATSAAGRSANTDCRGDAMGGTSSSVGGSPTTSAGSSGKDALFGGLDERQRGHFRGRHHGKRRQLGQRRSR
jgi:hypothetical protein